MVFAVRHTILGLVLSISITMSTDIEHENRHMYFAMYGSDLIGTETFTNLALSTTPSQAVRNKEMNISSLLHVEWNFFNFTSHGLRDDWREQWVETSNVARELLSNQSLIGFNLGDELVWNCINPEALTQCADTIRQDFPKGTAYIWYNEASAPVSSGMNSCDEKVNFSIPSSLDWFSVDIYHMDGKVIDWVHDHVESFYREYIYPNLTDSQSVLVVPGAFGSDVNHYPNGTEICNRTCYDVMCAYDADQFYEWSQRDSRIAAIAPWNWDGCPSCNGSRFTPPHTCCMDEIGTRDQPLTRAAWSRIGKEIITGSSGSSRSRTSND